MKNVLLRGGTGTGKTVTARAIAFYVGHEGQDIDTVYGNDFYADRYYIENFIQGDFVEYIQVHPSMSYEDIVYGIEIKPNQSLTINYVEKRIKAICDRAIGRAETFFIILDDIGRTNVGRLLGNLLYALEYRNQPVSLADGGTLIVPDNICFIATECKAAYGTQMEYAVRRRFDYVKDLSADKTVLNKYYSTVIHNGLSNIIITVFDSICNFVSSHIMLDPAIQVENYLPGHGMFIVDRCGTVNDILIRLKQKINYQVFPYLSDLRKNGTIIAKDDEIDNLLNLVMNQINAGQNSATNNATVKKIFSDTSHQGQPVPIFSIADSFNYYGKSIIPNGCTEHRTIIECIVDAIFLNGIFSVDKALSDILLDTKKIGFAHQTLPGTYASFLVDKKETDNYGYTRPKFRPYHSPNACAVPGTRWGPTPNPNYVPGSSKAGEKNKLNKDGKGIGYEVTFANGNTAVYIPLNAFRNTSAKINSYTIYGKDEPAAIYPALYHLIKTYLSAYESSLLLMSVSDSKYTDVYNLVKLENQYWDSKHAESIRQKGNPDKLSNLAGAVMKLRTLKNSAGTSLDVDLNKFTNLVNGVTPFSVAAYEDLYTITGTVKTITLEGVKTMIDVNDYQAIMENTNVRQMVFQGPPGTSKTFESQRFVLKNLDPNSSVAKDNNPKPEDISKALDPYKLTATDYANPSGSAKLKTGGWDLVQFHPSYGYEDFIRGIDVKPVAGQPVYESVNRLLGKISEFAKLAEKAAGQSVSTQDHPEQDKSKPKFYLIIDEINRANLATVFGELIYGLEYRDSEVSTPYEVNDRVTNGVTKDIVLGKNLYIIGTMNTADKSIDAIDYAIRRRFIFVDSPARRDVIINCYKNTMNVSDENSIELLVFDAVSKLFDDDRFFNDEYQKSDVKIGHTYFLRRDKDNYCDMLANRFVFQVIPILREYVKDGILNSYEEKSSLEHGAADIVNATNEDRAKLLSEEIMLFIKHFGEKDSANKIIDNKYIAEYLDDLCNQLGY